MREYFSEAVVLDKENSGDYDSRVFVFCKELGKLAPKAVSGRKIISKLAAHLEAGNLIKIRLVEKNGLRVADALKEKKLKIPLANLYFLNKILAEGEPDIFLWEMLANDLFDWVNVLKILGWDPANAFCSVDAVRPDFFRMRNQDFLCEKCASKLPQNELIYLKSVNSST